MVGTYNFGLVLLSILVATLASFTALDLAGRINTHHGRIAQVWYVGGALSLGTGIWAMHFIGMLAFSLPIQVSYDIPTTALSLVIGIIVSGFALSVAARAHMSRARLLAGAGLMGLGIAAMHYVGMAAMPMSIPVSYDPLLFSASIVIATAASLAALWIAFTLRAGHGARVFRLRVGAACLMGLAITGMHYTGMAAAKFDPHAICLTGGHANTDWLAATIALSSSLLLTITLMLSLFDARMASRTERLLSSLQAANVELQFRATHDQLTGLANRALSDDRLKREIAASQRSNKRFALLFIDFDRFKAVNDSLGHHAGDLLLTTAATRLPSILRASDSVARVGGDEFVIILPGAQEASDAAEVARKILTTLAAPILLQGTELHVSASIGIAMYPDDGHDSHELLVSADAAMTHAKNTGRGRYDFFSKEMSARARSHLDFENELRHAIENEDFQVHYQPKIDISTGEMVGMEALLRWFHPGRGAIPPSEFIPVAEENGMIVALGEWVLRAACKQNKAWQDQGMRPLRVAVNLSAKQFKQPGLLQSVSRILRETGLAAQYLELELTESVLMHNAAGAATVLKSLVAMGVQISVDDFGTGYSSLGYLKRFALEKLKIDRSFIRDTPDSAEDVAIVSAIISLAHSLHLKVIAEGVENEEQLDMLRALGCDEYQGYLASRPISALAFGELAERTGSIPA